MIKTIFLDRDGVINKYPGDKKYVTAWKDFRFLPRAKQAIARLTRKKFKLFIVSNQAGVGKRLFTQESLDEITRNMLRSINKSGGKIKKVYYCTHRADQNCPCRKPKAGLLHMARKDYRINLRESYFIGDTIRDIQTAQSAGCKSILVLCGKERMNNYKNWAIQPDFIFPDLDATAEFILKPK